MSDAETEVAAPATGDEGALDGADDDDDAPRLRVRLRRGRVALALAALGLPLALGLWLLLDLGAAGVEARLGFGLLLAWLAGLTAGWVRYRTRAFVLASGGVLLAVVAADTTLRFVPGPHSPTPIDGLLRYDERLGWRLRPGAEVVAKVPLEYAVTVRVGPDGFRAEPPGAAEEPPLRVAVLGDEHAAGFEVEPERAFTRRVGEALGPEVEVRSFCVPGYGPPQQLLLLEEVLADYDPAAVLLVLSMADDLGQGPGGKTSLPFRGRYPRPACQLALDGRPRIGRTEPLPTRERSGFIARTRLARLVAGLRPGGPPGWLRRCALDRGPDAVAETELLEGVLRAMAAMCSERGLRLLLALAPAPGQVGEERFGELLADLDYAPDEHARRGPQRRVVSFAAREGVPCLDLLPALDALGEEAYFAWHPRWTPAAHARIGDALATFVDKTGRLRDH